MGLFSDPVHDEFAGWVLGLAPYGGGDVGEVERLASQVAPGDDTAFFEAFSAMAERRVEEGAAAAAKGHTVTASDCYLRAALLFGVGYHPLYGAPIDPRLADAFRRQMAAFDQVMELRSPPGERIDVPYAGTRLPAYFVRAPGHEREVRPVLLVGGGWDSTLVENYLGIGLAALRRGYHVLLHDGPGQGRLLIEQGLPLRHDWEQVVTPVVDAALGIDVVDPKAIAYEAWSLGGYLAPRVAAFEHRLAAAIADPGQLDVGGKVLEPLAKMGLSPDAAAKLPHLDQGDEQRLMQVIDGNRELHWKVVQRGFWTNGAPDLTAWLAEMATWKLDDDLVAEIRCPTLVTAAESDPASSDARALYAALTCPKDFIPFYDADGAGMHCEMLNRSMANRTILDWLDDTLAGARR